MTLAPVRVGRMFALLRQTMLSASYIGGEGVDGGQGDSDRLYGSVDDSEQFGISSSLGDANSTVYSTGNTWVSLSPALTALQQQSR